jgi:hypothetical protein
MSNLELLTRLLKRMSPHKATCWHCIEQHGCIRNGLRMDKFEHPAAKAMFEKRWEPRRMTAQFTGEVTESPGTVVCPAKFTYGYDYRMHGDQAVVGREVPIWCPEGRD